MTTVADWQKPVAVALPAVIAPDEGICLYAQSGEDWYRAEIRGWWKNRLFVMTPEEACDGGVLAELDREKLKCDRYATHDGWDYFTPDGRKLEDAANKATLAAGPIKEKRYLQRYDDYHNSPTRGTWGKVRIYNFNERWVFVDWSGEGKLESVERVLRRDLSTPRGSMAYPGCVTFHNEAGVRAKAEKDKADEERRIWREKNEGEHTFIHCQDANILGLSLNGNTEAKVLAAFRKLSKVRHPDMGGSAQEFQRLCAAKDRALADLKAGGCKNCMSSRNT